MKLRMREVRAKAAEIHKCPKGYKGPCWGPLPSDYEKAERLLIRASKPKRRGK